MVDNPILTLALDTVKLNKQALVFAHSKASAEKTAEEIAYALMKKKMQQHSELAAQCLSIFERPTKQCERLAKCLEYNVAFHHAGLPAKQRHLIEEKFKEGVIKIIACTPTLAMGLNMPSFRAIIKDLKRYGVNGMAWISNLEYQQMAGRCGRPDFNDTHGEAIVIAADKHVKEEMYSRYIIGTPEDIYSKLAVEPVFRTYALSLIAAHSFKTKEQLFSFFAKTFWAHQYGDMHHLRQKLEKVICLLGEWEFIIGENTSSFVSAHLVDKERYDATPIGRRTAELYLDPLTAHDMIQGIYLAQKKTITPFSLLHLVSSTLEMRPLPHVSAKEIGKIEKQFIFHTDEILNENYDEEYLTKAKTALLLFDWINEADEETIYEKYSVRPGELHLKLELADWLLFALGELSRLTPFSLQKEITTLRIRLSSGVKEELLPLLKFEGIGKVRARILYTHGIRDVVGVKKASFSMLTTLLGKHIALSLKKQVGMPVEKEEKASTLVQWSAK